MRILFYSTYFYPYISGLTTYSDKILSYLGQKNDVVALTFQHSKSLRKIEMKNKIKVIRMPYVFRISKGFISPQSLFYFLKEVKNKDIVLLNIPNFEGLFLAVLAKIFGKKIISIFHCEVYLGGGLIAKIINFFLNSSIFIQLLLSNIIVGYTQNYADQINTLKLFKNKLRFNLPPIANLKADEHYFKNLLTQKKARRYIGFAGRVAREKGLEYLVEALNKLNSESLDLIVAGPYGQEVVGENQLFSKIINLLDKTGINYKFLGNLDQSKLAAFYKAIDLLVLPSVNKTEAFGMVQAEAMLHGTPVIATDMPGVRIPIKLTKMGLLVKPKNSQQLGTAIDTILKNRVKFTNPKLIENATSIFDIKNVYKFWDRIIDEKS